jgi:hypothetical protein
MRCTVVSKEVPGMLVLHCNGRPYVNAYLISFKLGLMHTHLPLLEAQAEGFFGNRTEFGSRAEFDVLFGCDTCPLEAHFQSREQRRVTRS